MFRPGPAPAALGFVSSCLEISRGHLILPLAPSERPSCQGSASLALPLLGSSPHLQRPSFLGLSLASPTAIFRPGLLVLSFLFPEIESLPAHSFSCFSPNFPYTCLFSWRNAEDLGTSKVQLRACLVGTYSPLCRGCSRPFPTMWAGESCHLAGSPQRISCDFLSAPRPVPNA